MHITKKENATVSKMHIALDKTMRYKQLLTNNTIKKDELYFNEEYIPEMVDITLISINRYSN